MTITMNRKQVLAISKLDFTGLGHSQKLDLIAKTLGLRNQATMMTMLKTQKLLLVTDVTFGIDDTPVDPYHDADTIIAHLINSPIHRMFSEGLHLFIADTSIHQEALALRLSSRMFTDTLIAPTVMVIRDETSGKRAVDLAAYGPVFGCMHGNEVKRTVELLRSWVFPEGTVKKRVLESASVISEYYDDPSKISIHTFPMHDATLKKAFEQEGLPHRPRFVFNTKTDMVKGGVLDGTKSLIPNINVL